MSIQPLIRTCLFVVMFTVGATALGIAVLRDDLLEYYHNRQQVEIARRQARQIQDLNADYRALIQRLTDNPELVRRLDPRTLSPDPDDPNRASLAARTEELRIAQQVLAQGEPSETIAGLPPWLQRITPGRRRIALLLAGAALVLVAFVFFGTVRAQSSEPSSPA